MTFSPLYITFFGWFVRFFDDAWQAMIAHRIVVVLLTSTGTWLVARRILPSVWAWFAAVWWVVLPINWNAYFEVHVFGFGLLMWAIAFLGAQNRFAKAAGVALFVMAALLVRNEYLPAILLLLVWMTYSAWKSGRLAGLSAELRIIGGGLIATLLAITWLYSGNSKQLDLAEVFQGFKARQRVNLQQVYPFGYQQRNPDFREDPWTQGSALMQRDFGRKDPTMGEALVANPKAFSEHVAWNCSLIPAGLQFGMLGRYYGTITPDFGAMKGSSLLAAFLFAGVIGIIICGLFRFIRNPQTRDLLKRYLRPRATTIAALSCTLPSVMLAIFTQRPRPSYIFPLTFSLMLLTLFCLRVLIIRLAGISQRARTAGKTILVVVGVLLVIVVPPTGRPSKNLTPIKDDYMRLKQHRDLFPDAVFCSDVAWGEELSNYLSSRHAKRIPAVPLASVIQRGMNLGLDEKRINLLYLSPGSVSREEVKEWRSSADEKGWKKVGGSELETGKSWELWSRVGESHS
jgi:hypothetical protein